MTINHHQLYQLLMQIQLGLNHCVVLYKVPTAIWLQPRSVTPPRLGVLDISIAWHPIEFQHMSQSLQSPKVTQRGRLPGVLCQGNVFSCFFLRLQLFSLYHFIPHLSSFSDFRKLEKGLNNFASKARNHLNLESHVPSARNVSIALEGTWVWHHGREAHSLWPSPRTG